MIRAYLGMATMLIAIIALMRPMPSTVTIAIASRISGNTSIRSMTRMMTVSSQPPAYPATAPAIDPKMIEIPAVTNPMNSEIRVPNTTRLNTSRKFPSSPMRCSGCDAGQPRMWMHGSSRAVAPTWCRSSMFWYGS